VQSSNSIKAALYGNFLHFQKSRTIEAHRQFAEVCAFQHLDNAGTDGFELVMKNTFGQI